MAPINIEQREQKQHAYSKASYEILACRN